MAYEGKRSAGVKKKGGLLLIAGLLVFLAVGGLLWSFLVGSGQREENMQTEVIPEDDVIQTPFGELAYPGMWTDRVSHKTVEDGTDLRIVFCSASDGTELFALCYGTVPDGAYVMGEMADGTAVSVDMNTLEPGTADELYSLQESINDLLVQIREDPEFTAAP